MTSDFYCPKCNNKLGRYYSACPFCATDLITPTPSPEEPSGADEAVRNQSEEYVFGMGADRGSFHHLDFQNGFRAGAKWQSTRNTPEWPSEEQVAFKIGGHQPLYKKGFRDAIQWLKSILNK